MINVIISCYFIETYTKDRRKAENDRKPWSARAIMLKWNQSSAVGRHLTAALNGLRWATTRCWMKIWNDIKTNNRRCICFQIHPLKAEHFPKNKISMKLRWLGVFKDRDSDGQFSAAFSALKTFASGYVYWRNLLKNSHFC